MVNATIARQLSQPYKQYNEVVDVDKRWSNQRVKLLKVNQTLRMNMLVILLYHLETKGSEVKAQKGLHKHGPRGRCPREKLLLPNQHLQIRFKV